MKTRRMVSIITVAALAAVGIACVFAAACKKKDNDDDVKEEHTHSYGSGVVTLEPTCDEAGVMTYTCVDGDDEYTESIPALGHILTGTYGSDGTWTYTCSRSGCKSASIDVAKDPVESLTFVAGSGAAFVSANSVSVNSAAETVIDVTAVIAIPSGTTECKLERDVVVEDGAAIGVTASLTLDLNGKSVTKSESATDGLGTVQVGSSASQYGTLIIKDGSTAGTGTISGFYAVTVFGVSGTTVSSLTVQGGNITSTNGIAISTNYNYSNVTISVTGGKISSAEGTAIYLPGGALTVSGGEISGDTGIEIRSGSLTVTGGTISTTATGTPATPGTSSSNGTTASGYAIAETNNSSYGSTVSVAISGGTIDGTMYSTGDNISVAGGTFSVDPSSFVASGYAANPDGTKWNVTASSN